jgi:fructoselysine-6-P-deglycase FrlB-like protein
VASWREAAGWGESDAFAASEMPLRRQYDAVVAVSRSGTTTEVLRLIEALPAGQEVLAITADAKSPVARAARRCVPLPFADEQAVVQTRFATSVLALWRAQFGHDVEGLSRTAEDRLRAPLPHGLTGHHQFVFLGTGPGAALAAEACLKFREAALAWAESYASMEFRHGPISLLDRHSLVWSLGELPAGLAEEILDSGAALEVSAADPMAELVRAQRAAVELAKSKGLDPSRPRRLSRSVVLP